MITRIEIDGFKSFADFALDLPPFLAVIGTNASGKSNLVEALTFLSVAAAHGLDDAVAAVRGDARGLFRQRGDGSRVDKMCFAVELLFNEPDARESNRWRYELNLAWSGADGGLEGIIALHRRFIPVAARHDSWVGRVEMHKTWRERYVSYADSPESIAVDSGPTERRDIPLVDPPAHRSEFLEPLEWELERVRALQLDTVALREPSEFGGPLFMDARGHNLPNFLRWLARRTSSEQRPLGAVADIETHLVGLVREVTGVEVVEDQRRRDVRLEFLSPYVGIIGAEFASDGTLRMLAILAALHNPRGGLIAIEEPENGVFPERLRHMLGLMQELVVNPGEKVSAEPDVSEPLTQVLITSHSPLILEEVPSRNVAFLDTTTVLEEGVASHITRVRWIRGAGQRASVENERWPRVTESELTQFRAGIEART